LEAGYYSPRGRQTGTAINSLAFWLFVFLALIPIGRTIIAVQRRYPALRPPGVGLVLWNVGALAVGLATKTPWREMQRLEGAPGARQTPPSQAPPV
jgi:hypothetical protein